jgi:hypothetical protein
MRVSLSSKYISTGAPVRVLRLSEDDLAPAACAAEIIERERRGKFSAGIGLGQQVFGLPFDGVDGVGTGGPTSIRRKCGTVLPNLYTSRTQSSQNFV